MTCAMTMVQKPEATFEARNSESSEEPRTTSGVVSGRTSSMLTVPDPRQLYRQRARAISAPKSVATVVDTAATFRLSFIASTSAG